MTNRLFFDIDADSNVFDEIKKESKSVGYYSLPNANLDYLDSYKKEFALKNKDVKHLVIIGIGGSSLGLKAIYRTLKNIKNLS